MSNREQKRKKILEALLAARARDGQSAWVSGQELAQNLGLSRTAIWQLLQELQAEGYAVQAQSRLGYRLAAEIDPLDRTSLLEALELWEKHQPQQPQITQPSHPSQRATHAECGAGADLSEGQKKEAAFAFEVEYHPVLLSTNTLALERARQGAVPGLLIVAGQQTGGRGRFGRPFFSPKDSGLYMSLLLPCALAYEARSLITSLAAVAVAEALDETAAFFAQRMQGEPGIKWVNDCYVAGRKVAGILTEASLDMESGGLQVLVLGIGINVYEPDEGFPEELQGIAGACFEQKVSGLRAYLAAAVMGRIRRFWSQIQNEAGRQNVMQRYRERSCVLGTWVQVRQHQQWRWALAESIDDEGRLGVRYLDARKLDLQKTESEVVQEGKEAQVSSALHASALEDRLTWLDSGEIQISPPLLG